MASPYMKEQDVAELMQVSLSTLQKWRMNGTGPKFFKFGSRIVRYRESDIKAYLMEGRQDEEENNSV